MSSHQNNHVPFAQLSIAERFLYFLGAVGAIGLLRPWPPIAEEIGEDLRRIWDEQKYTPADVVDFSTMAVRLEPHLTKYADRARRVWIPELPPQKRRRNQK